MWGSRQEADVSSLGNPASGDELTDRVWRTNRSWIDHSIPKMAVLAVELADVRCGCTEREEPGRQQIGEPGEQSYRQRERRQLRTGRRDGGDYPAIGLLPPAKYGCPVARPRGVCVWEPSSARGPRTTQTITVVITAKTDSEPKIVYAIFHLFLATACYYLEVRGPTLRQGRYWKYHFRPCKSPRVI